ncbi:helix-turn-helix domain-containing protein [Streptomyces sp. NBRC 109706]|uniref:helix-turn-helix domain-containing protein n=1 Tax=Streptomyces sp. NBRC 109706 TaxID=1550035 RepID=UPI000780DB0A|nr:helix-turn-helix transcriptional regulator [Streptomyces sp. NBRC 109706]
MSAASFGERLQVIRKRRGLTQRGLADESGVSLSLIRKLEQGERTDTRLETARKLAAALSVPTTTLIAAEAGDAAPAQGVEAERWADVGSALAAGPDEGSEIEESPTAAGVGGELDRAISSYTSGDLGALATALPRLIRDANLLAEQHPAAGRMLRMEVLQMTGRLMTQTRNYGIADTAFAAAERIAPDELHGAALANNRTWLLLRRGRLAEASALATRWADDLEPRLSRATPAELSAWGWLLLRVAATASRDARSEEAAHAIRLATAAAVTIGPARASSRSRRAGFIRVFTPLTVAMQRAEQAMVEEKPDAVLTLADRIRATRLPPTTANRNRHLLDVTHAQVLTRQDTEAVDTLLRIERDAPQWLPHQRYAREVLALLVQRRRTLTPEMRHLADVVRLPL